MSAPSEVQNGASVCYQGKRESEDAKKQVTEDVCWDKESQKGTDHGQFAKPHQLANQVITEGRKKKCS